MVGGRAWVLLVLLFLAGVAGGCGNIKEQAEERLYTKPEAYFSAGQEVIGISTVATGLNVPWEITWGPDGWIWYSEIGGTIGKFNPATGETKVLLELEDVFTRTTPGLLGMAVHPDREHHPYLFLLYTRKEDEETVVLQVMRYTLENDRCTSPRLLLEVPGGLGHNGARIKVGEDGNLYIATGEATRSEKAQNVCEPGGKVLRIRTDGTVPPDNPFPDNPVWAWGFRNPQGLVLTPGGRIYASDHGDATDDEVNLVKKGANYGWPDVRGFCDTEAEKRYCADSAIAEPLKAWTPTIAPAGMEFYDSEAIPAWKRSLLLTTLKGSSLRVLHLDPSGTAIGSETVLFGGQFGRLRDVCVSPAGDVYIATSNRDWNPLGAPQPGDDRIIRLFRLDEIPGSVPEYRYGPETAGDDPAELPGQKLYTDFCSACHKPGGQGVPGTFPPLAENPLVSGDQEKLIRIVLNGISGAGEPMPSFAFMSDEEIAQVLTYIRIGFGNESRPVSPEAVEQLR